MAQTLEPPHPPLPLARGLVRVLGAIVQPLVPTVIHAREHRTRRHAVAGELVRDDHAWNIREPLKQLAQELRGRALVAPGLHEDVEHITILVDGSPEEVVLHAVDLNEDLIEMPLVARARPTATQRIGVLLA